MNMQNTNTTDVEAAVVAQTVSDFKNATLIVSVTINASLLFVWVLTHAALGTL